jgi:hypothetical protein
MNAHEPPEPRRLHLCRSPNPAERDRLASESRAKRSLRRERLRATAGRHWGECKRSQEVLKGQRVPKIITDSRFVEQRKRSLRRQRLPATAGRPWGECERSHEALRNQRLPKISTDSRSEFKASIAQIVTQRVRLFAHISTPWTRAPAAMYGLGYR